MEYEQLSIFEEKRETNVEETKQVVVESVAPLTERQKALYRLIRHNSIEEHRKTTQKEICDKLSGFGYEYVEKDASSHDHCSAIWTDIAKINESVETRKLIISKNFEYWLGSERENQEFIKGLWKALAPRLHRYWAYLKKTEQNGLGTFIDANGKVIDDTSKAQRFIQAFIDYDIEMQKEVE